MCRNEREREASLEIKGIAIIIDGIYIYINDAHAQYI